MKKLLISLLSLSLAIAGGAYFTQAFFSDSETSIDNTFAAGSIDLKVGNQSYYNGEASPNTSWNLKNLEIEKYFDFDDIKPGDEGEDTITLKVNDNDAWACAKIILTNNDENVATDPEKDAGDVSDLGGDLFDGELAQNLHFVWWPDDGDNVLEESEAAKIHLNDKLLTLMTFDDPDDTELDLTLADSVWNFWDDSDSGNPMIGGQEYYIGKAWCFGDLTLVPVADGDGVDPTVDSGVLCDGVNVDNMSQTDTVVGDIEFTAVQKRNNEDYLCPEHQQ
jgi:hypothetical protein